VQFASLGGKISAQMRTNGNGFFSFYYTNGDFGQLVPAIDHWSLLISGTLNGCAYQRVYNHAEIFWNPANTTDPSLSSYYVTDAEWDVGNEPINPLPPCSL